MKYNYINNNITHDYMLLYLMNEKVTYELIFTKYPSLSLVLW